MVIPQGDRSAVANTGDSPATILKYYGKLLEVVMRRFVENKPIIPNERVKATGGQPGKFELTGSAGAVIHFDEF